MPRPARSRPAHRPLLLTPEAEERLVELTRLGVSVGLAAQGAGVNRSTAFRWLARGRAETEARAAGAAPRPEEELFAVLYGRIAQARAIAAMRAVRRIQEAGAGGFVVSARTRRYRDPVTGVPVEETTVRRSPPDWRAFAWLLERLFPDEYGKRAVGRDSFDALDADRPAEAGPDWAAVHAWLELALGERADLPGHDAHPSFEGVGPVRPNGSDTV
ncbi:hypothetical protein QZH56_37175 (plasmid) [Streptomyces olivoreticuli]|uniref:hypothetical protein n=1 Tax=Streptomyces olivoreticuli TaxID=68246 RepID=UPI0026587476|nr:hypothetical protein [Streptomyces olivoreticuli]WKK27822.1 hypothetical protein QZH56_37175 [Streptomyces olivoreticuli]